MITGRACTEGKKMHIPKMRIPHRRYMRWRNKFRIGRGNGTSHTLHFDIPEWNILAYYAPPWRKISVFCIPTLNLLMKYGTSAVKSDSLYLERFPHKACSSCEFLAWLQELCLHGSQYLFSAQASWLCQVNNQWLQEWSKKSFPWMVLINIPLLLL